MPPTKGVRIKLGGKNRVLRYTTRSLDRLETATDMAQSQILARANIGSVRYVIWVLWAGLIHEQPDLERDTVVDWLDALTDEETKALEAALQEALGESAPEAEDEPEGNVKAAS
jgi:hypothetical protein